MELVKGFDFMKNEGMARRGRTRGARLQKEIVSIVVNNYINDNERERKNMSIEIIKGSVSTKEYKRVGPLYRRCTIYD